MRENLCRGCDAVLPRLYSRWRGSSRKAVAQEGRETYFVGAFLACISRLYFSAFCGGRMPIDVKIPLEAGLRLTCSNFPTPTLFQVV